MGAFLTSEMDRRFAYPLMFGARVLRRTSRNQGCPCFTVPLRGKGVPVNTLLEDSTPQLSSRVRGFHLENPFWENLYRRMGWYIATS